MSRIKILDIQTANKIAAGEVITNPAAIVKELLENSIDAESSVITVEIKKGGKELISIIDNGLGISPEDVKIAFKRHATSKINSVEDLEDIQTLGFRGEALASIAAVSKVSMLTKERKANNGIHISLNGGKIVEYKKIGCSIGTAIKVEDIFYNTPARYKYLKKDSIESSYISSIMERIALSHPEISFRFINNDKQVFHTPGNSDLLSCVYSLYGKKFAENLINVEYSNDPLRIQGFIGKPELSRSNRKNQIFFINQRYVKSKILSQALEDAYKNYIMIHKYPVAILNLNLPPHMLDVNVHPAKTEIRFQNESLIYLLAKQAFGENLKKESLIPEVSLHNDKIENNKKGEEDAKKTIQREFFFPSSLKESPSSFYHKVGEEEISRENSGNGSKEIGFDDNKDISNKKGVKGTQEKEFNKFPKVLNSGEEGLLENYSQTHQNQDILYELKLGRVLGQAMNTYIIVEIQEGLLFIDQHAAHERIGYNRLLKQYKESKIISQNLLIPITLQLSFHEYQIIKEYISMLNKLGFEIEEFGDRSILLRSVPLIFDKPTDEKYLLEIIDHLQEFKELNSTQEKEKKLISMACKSAIKANDHLRDEEIHQLLEDLVNTEQPYTCPHGRPTIIKLTKYELEKLFKRVQ